MKRKIIRLGQATYVMSLPSKWIRESNLNKGDYIEVEEKDGNLIISTQKAAQRTEVTLDLHNFNERTIQNVLNQTYRKGFDVIRLKYATSEQLKSVRRITKETLLGFEVVKEEKGFCTLENIAEPSVEKYDVILRKLFLVIKNEAEEIILEVKEGTLTNQARRDEIKNNVDNYTNFIRRLIIKYKIQGAKDSYLLFYAISLLSLIHHGYYYLYQYLGEKKNIHLSAETKHVFQKVNELFTTYYAAFYKNDYTLAHQISVDRKKIMQQEIYPLLEAHKGIENVVLSCLNEIMRMIHLSSTAIFGLAAKEKPGEDS